MGGGVAGAIKRAGGAEIEREAVAQGPVEAGEAVVTGAGRLPCRYVIHAATMGQGLETSADLIRRATHSSLRRAEELKIGTLAFPALGTGVGGFPVDHAARLMVEEVAAHLHGPSSLREVIFVVISADTERAFHAALSTLPRA
jgi:O-acetyl-ADP-ribose deacetylase (regulator of RNase III)